MGVANIYRVRTVLSGWQGGPGLATHYFETGVTNNATDALVAAARVRGAWDVVKGVFAGTTTMQVQGQVDVLDCQNGALVGSFGVTPPAVVTGTGAGVTGPAEVAGGLIYSASVVINGRRLVGRTNISPLRAGETATVSPSAGLNSGIDAMGVALLTISPPASIPLVVWHRPTRLTPTSPLANGAEYPALTSTHAGKFFALRSRRD